MKAKLGKNKFQESAVSASQLEQYLTAPLRHSLVCVSLQRNYLKRSKGRSVM